MEVLELEDFFLLFDTLPKKSPVTRLLTSED